MSQNLVAPPPLMGKEKGVSGGEKVSVWTQQLILTRTKWKVQEAPVLESAMNMLQCFLLLKWRKNTTKSIFKWLRDRTKLQGQSIVHWDPSKGFCV
jgi:hypothetical protein